MGKYLVSCVHVYILTLLFLSSIYMIIYTRSTLHCNIMIYKHNNTQTTARNLIMTEDEITAVLDKANFCVESECAVDDVEDLINELKDQQKVLSTRLETIMNVVAHLQHANEQDARKTDDVRAIVKDMLRVFTTQVSCLYL